MSSPHCVQKCAHTETELSNNDQDGKSQTAIIIILHLQGYMW